MDGNKAEAEVSKFESRLLNRKDRFKGFQEVKGQAISELSEHLGISLFGVRTFHYQGEPRFATIRRRLGVLDDRVGKFIEDPMHRGFYDSDQDAVFMKPDDHFAEIHELGHAFEEKSNPGLVELYINGRMGAEGVNERVAVKAMEEGMAQWIAVATSFLTHDPEKVKQAILENNKMVADMNALDTFNYDPEVMAQKLATVKGMIADYAKIPALQKRGNPIVAQENYAALLKNFDFYRGLMSLGYVYTMACIADESQSGRRTSEVLRDLAKTPPTFAKIEEKVLGFSGQVDFQNIRV